jgi:hypothetical protein
MDRADPNYRWRKDQVRVRFSGYRTVTRVWAQAELESLWLREHPVIAAGQAVTLMQELEVAGALVPHDEVFYLVDQQRLKDWVLQAY